MRFIGLGVPELVLIGVIVIVAVYGYRSYKQKKLAAPAVSNYANQQVETDSPIDWRYPCVAAIAALVFMLLPWLRLPILQQLSLYASYFDWTSQTEWTMFSLIELVDVLNNIRDVLHLAALPIGMTSLFFLIAGWVCWAVTLVMLAVGVCRSFARKSYAPLRYNGIRVVVSSALRIIGVFLANMELSSGVEAAVNMHVTFLSAPMWPWLALMAGAVLMAMPKLGRAKAVDDEAHS